MHPRGCRHRYTRLQLLSLCYTTIVLNAVCALLFAGVDQCRGVQVLTAALLSAVLSGVVTVLGKLLFKRASKRGEGRAALTWYKFTRDHFLAGSNRPRPKLATRAQSARP